MKERIVFLVGPTGVGKTRISIKLAKKINGEVISCDSMQVYKGMRVLSQSPMMSDLKAVRHHIISVVDPAKQFNAAKFRDKACSAIKIILGGGRIPIVVGGTGLYAKALIDGLFPSPKADMRFRKKMEGFADRYGSARLHARLEKLDPDSAAVIHPNDLRRTIRALEVCNSTGQTMTQLKLKTEGLGSLYEVSIFGLKASRDKLYPAIDRRIDKMFKDGITREVKRLKKKRLSKTARFVLGYKEVCGYLEGRYDIDAAKELLKTNTRRYAKRQMTWFRADKRIRWFDVNRVSDTKIVSSIISIIIGNK